MRLYRGVGIDGWSKRYKSTGEYRPPKRGEFYLSGAIPEVYRASNDLQSSYHIMKEVTKRESHCKECGRMNEAQS